MSKNTSKMTLYEVTKKVAKINKSKAADVEKVPDASQKPEKINKKLKMPLVLPPQGHMKRPVSRQYPKQKAKLLFKKPYVIAGSVLAVILLFWIVSSFKKDKPAPEITQAVDSPGISETQSSTPIQVTPPPQPKPTVQKPASRPIDPVLDVKASPPTEPAGDHVIVLAHYRSRDQLLPLVTYFRNNGFETLIEKSGTQYVLMTKDRYQNPNHPGNDGYTARKKLIEIGNKYEPESGFLPFSFDDIYGKKIN